MTNKIALITGAAKRVGSITAKTLHAQGFNIAIHYRGSQHDAEKLAAELNTLRANSAITLQADLLKTEQLPKLIDAVLTHYGQLDLLVNNASSFYPTPIGTATEQQWDDLIGSNVKAPFFLAQAAASALAKQNGCIVNIVDIHAAQPLKSHTIYCIAKAGLQMLTKSLAKELGPHVRVNGVAPGAVLWPDDANELDEKTRQQIVSRTALKREGAPQDIANMVTFLATHATYVTGQIIAVDGGRSLNF